MNRYKGIKPCPFCGVGCYAHQCTTGTYVIRARGKHKPDCYLWLTGGNWFNNAADAAKVWNTRKP